jgi:DNA-binding HxlR family transcriptional regulator
MGHKTEEYCHSCSEAIYLFQGKWKTRILCAMREGPVRLGQLARAIPGASKKVLTENLRELQRAGLIVRQEYNEALRHVEYDFSKDVRQELHAMLDHLDAFGTSLRDTLRVRSGKPSSARLDGTPITVGEELPKRKRHLA